jgi:hypothetical protein
MMMNNSQEQETKINPVRARSEIVGLCHKLFEVLTGQKLDSLQEEGDDSDDFLDKNEMIADSKAAEDNMREIATFYASSGERAVVQRAVIPTAKALEKCRDISYEAVSKARKDEESIQGINNNTKQESFSSQTW